MTTNELDRMRAGRASDELWRSDDATAIAYQTAVVRAVREAEQTLRSLTWHLPRSDKRHPMHNGDN